MESFLLSYESDREEKCVAQKKSSKKQVTEKNRNTAKCLLLMFSLTSCVQTHKRTLKMNQITKIKRSENSQDEQKHLKSFFRYYTESAISHQQNGLVMQMIVAYCTGSSPVSQKKGPSFHFTK